MKKLFASLKKIKLFFPHRIRNKTDLLNLLRSAASRDVIELNTLDIIENIFSLDAIQARQIMTAKPHIVSIDSNSSASDAVKVIINAGHSRLPVLDTENNQIKGLILAKDALHLVQHEKQDSPLADLIRPVISIPESQNLNLLLNEFKLGGHHMAIVVDEYNKIAGLITIADILEKAIGYIQDDYDKINNFIRPLPQLRSAHKSYIVKATTPVLSFNQYFKTSLDNIDNDTIGGIVLQQFPHIPRQDEYINLGNMRFSILKADARRIQLLQVDILS